MACPSNILDIEPRRLFTSSFDLLPLLTFTIRRLDLRHRGFLALADGSDPFAGALWSCFLLAERGAPHVCSLLSHQLLTPTRRLEACKLTITIRSSLFPIPKHRSSPSVIARSAWMPYRSTQRFVIGQTRRATDWRVGPALSSCRVQERATVLLLVTTYLCVWRKIC